MNYNKINWKNLKSISPNTGKYKYDDNEDHENYMKYYNIYRFYLTKYLINKLELVKYDDELLNSNLEYLEFPKEKMDIYQYFSSNLLHYFYIRNNVYIEKLNKDELLYFKELLVNKKDINEIYKFIEKTYKKVIKETLKQSNDNFSISFAPKAIDNNVFFAKNTDIVIGIRFDDYNLNGLSDKDWADRYLNQNKFLNKLINKMNNDFTNKSYNDVKIFRYTQYQTDKISKFN